MKAFMTELHVSVAFVDPVVLDDGSFVLFLVTEAGGGDPSRGPAVGHDPLAVLHEVVDTGRFRKNVRGVVNRQAGAVDQEQQDVRQLPHLIQRDVPPGAVIVETRNLYRLKTFEGSLLELEDG